MNLLCSFRVADIKVEMLAKGIMKDLAGGPDFVMQITA